MATQDEVTLAVIVKIDSDYRVGVIESNEICLLIVIDVGERNEAISWELSG